MIEVGEKVYIDGRYGGFGSIGVVDRITPTGRIVVGNIQYRAPSKMQGDDDWCSLQTGDGFSGGVIRKLTEKREQEVQKGRLHNRINDMRSKYSTRSDTSLDDLVEIAATWEKLMRLVGK